jgi:hypothetical protein
MVNDFITYKNKLYVGIGSWTFGLENSLSKGIWRSANGKNWTRVVFGGFDDPQFMEFGSFSVFRNTLYASTWSFNPEHGAEIWSTTNGDIGTWILNVTNGFGNMDNSVIQAMVEYKGCLYAGTTNENAGVEGAEIWRTCDGTNWKQVMQNGFGNPYNDGISALGVYKNRLYAGTRNWYNPDAGAALWMCTICNGKDWKMVPVEKGFGDANNFAINNLFSLNNQFFVTMNNRVTGLEIWQTFNGRNWIQINPDGFGDSLNYFTTRGSLPMAEYYNRVYFGTLNPAQGGEIWKLCCPIHKPIWPWWFSCWAGAPPYQCNSPINECDCNIP